MDKLKNYFGAKEGGGMYQQLISLIPPHNTYYELFGGSLTLFRYKKLARYSILNDANSGITDKYVCTGPCLIGKYNYAGHPEPIDESFFRDHIIIRNKAAEKIILTISQGNGSDTFMYLDPPYIETTRRSMDNYAEFEMSMDDHRALISIIAKVNYNCMISCYDNRIYQAGLKGWNKKRFEVQSRNGKRLETVYFNYAIPHTLHDYRYIGKDATDRQRIKRKIQSVLDKYELLDPIERNAIINKLNEKFRDS